MIEQAGGCVGGENARADSLNKLLKAYNATDTMALDVSFWNSVVFFLVANRNVLTMVNLLFVEIIYNKTKKQPPALNFLVAADAMSVCLSGLDVVSMFIYIL